MSRLLSVIAATVLVFAGGCSSDPESEAQPSWLFTFSGSGVSETIEGQRYLTVTDPTEVVAFTSRPDRTQVRLPAGAIVALWQGLGFQEVPPNAAVTSAGKSQAVVLQNPAVTDDGSLRFLAVGLQDLAGPTAVTIDNGVVNSEVTDAVTQTNVQVLGTETAQSLATDYKATAAALQNSVQTNASDQQLQSVDTSADVNEAIQRMLAMSDGQGVPGSGTPTSNP